MSFENSSSSSSLNNLKEPLWAQGKSDESIQHTCRALNVPIDQIEGKNRTELIKLCGYLNRYPSLKNDFQTLRGKCAKASKRLASDAEIQNMSEEELEDCIVESRTGLWLDKLKINDTQDTEKIIAPLQDLKSNEKARVISTVLEGENRLRDHLEKANYDENTQELLMDLVLRMQRGFAVSLEKRIKLLQETHKPTPEEEKLAGATSVPYNSNETNINSTQNRENTSISSSSFFSSSSSNWSSWFWFGAKLWQGVTSLLAKGLNIVNFIISHPQTARMLLIVAEQIRDRLCREISMSLGLVGLRSKKPWTEVINDFLSSSSEIAQEVVFLGAQRLLTGPKFDDLWNGLGGLMSATFAALTAGFSVYLPGFSVLGDLCISTLKEASRDTAELYFFQKTINENFGHFLGILNIRKCLQTQFLTQEQIEARNIQGPSSSSSSTVSGGGNDNEEEYQHFPSYKYQRNHHNLYKLKNNYKQIHNNHHNRESKARKNFKYSRDYEEEEQGLTPYNYSYSPKYSQGSNFESTSYLPSSSLRRSGRRNSKKW